MERFIAIDYLRNFANFCRCIIHAAVPYMVTKAPIWPVDDNGDWFFDFTIFEIHLFVMELFFVISGFMFMMLLKKKSTYKVIIDRFKRIFIPFLLGLLILIPIVLSLFSLSSFSGSELIKIETITKCYSQGWKLAIQNLFPTAHLWFLFYLIIFYTLTILFKKNINYINNLSVKQILFIGIIISSICMFFMDRWIVDNPLTLIPDIPSLIHYYIFFIIGILIFNSSRFLKTIIDNSKRIFIAGLFIALLASIPQIFFERNDLYYYQIIELLAILLSCSSSYLLVIGFWGIAYNLKLPDSKTLRYITDSSYWVYIINMPIVTIIQIVLMPFDISIFLKFIIVLCSGLFISMFSYEYFVRYTFIGTILNKKRHRKPKY